MVKVVAAVGATLVMEAIQSPRSPTDLSRSPAPEAPPEGSLLMAWNLSGAWRRPGELGEQDGGPAQDDWPVSRVGDGDGAIAADDEGVLGFRAADGRVPRARPRSARRRRTPARQAARPASPPPGLARYRP